MPVTGRGNIPLLISKDCLALTKLIHALLSLHPYLSEKMTNRIPVAQI